MEQKFKVGDKVRCINGLDDPDYFNTGDILTVISVDECGGYLGVKSDSYESGAEWNMSRFELVVEEPEPSFPKQFQVDVAGFAMKNGMTLDQAHEIIQPKLFEMGYKWNDGKKMCCKYTNTLQIGVFADNEITHNTEIISKYGPLAEIEYEVVYKINLKAPRDTILINDKVYDKLDVLNLLKQLTPIEE